MTVTKVLDQRSFLKTHYLRNEKNIYILPEVFPWLLLLYKALLHKDILKMNRKGKSNKKESKEMERRKIRYNETPRQRERDKNCEAPSP